MTTGTMIFFSGVGLLILTIILAIIFALKKPQYIPESAVYDGTVDGSTQKFRNGYPTDRMTIRREKPQAGDSGTLELGEETELLPEEDAGAIPDTEILPDTELPAPAVLDKQKKGKMETETLPLTDETMLLPELEDASSALMSTVYASPTLLSETDAELICGTEEKPYPDSHAIEEETERFE